LAIAALLAIGILAVDATLFLYAEGKTSAAVGWDQIVGALAIQSIVIGMLVAWFGMRRQRAKPQTDSEFSYRSHIPLTIIGLVLVSLGFSLCLLYIGVACPGHGIPTTRGTSLCS